MINFHVIERWSYDLKQLQPLESKIIFSHHDRDTALEVAHNTHPWDMNYTEWYVEIEEIEVQ